MEAGAAEVPVLEAEERTAVLGIDHRELMGETVSVDFDDTRIRRFCRNKGYFQMKSIIIDSA